MDLPSYFADFLEAIRPGVRQRQRMKEAHVELKERLEADPTLKPILVSTFIQGSYRRHTGLVGTKEHQCDVDLVVVTSIPSITPPSIALDLFKPFLDRHYKDRYEPQGRSWCIHYDDEITLDLVPTSAPSEANLSFFRSLGNGFTFEDPVYEWGHIRGTDTLLDVYTREVKKGWQAEPLEIPDREAKKWEQTHPLAQIAWFADKNAACSGHYINVVRAIKWWHRMKEPLPKYPKGYPLEHLVGECCPYGIENVAAGVADTFSAIVDRYPPVLLPLGKPQLADHGVPSHDVFQRVSAEDYRGFYSRSQPAADLADRARRASTVVDSAKLWRTLFGEMFPAPPADESDNGSGGSNRFTERKDRTEPSGGRFA